MVVVPQLVPDAGPESWVARDTLAPPRAEGRRRLRKARAPPAARTYVVPQGGALAIECTGGTHVQKVLFASFGMPVVHANGSVGINPECHSPKTLRAIERACVGQSHCCLPVGTDNFRDDPCRGKVKTLAVTLQGCDEHRAPTRYKRHCSLLGQPLLCDEDVEFLSTLSLPPAAEPLKPHVALMVDTSC